MRCYLITFIKIYVVYIFVYIYIVYTRAHRYLYLCVCTSCKCTCVQVGLIFTRFGNVFYSSRLRLYDYVLKVTSFCRNLHRNERIRFTHPFVRTHNHLTSPPNPLMVVVYTILYMYKSIAKILSGVGNIVNSAL